jgi:hypothetical protein
MEKRVQFNQKIWQKEEDRIQETVVSRIAKARISEEWNTP